MTCPTETDAERIIEKYLKCAWVFNKEYSVLNEQSRHRNSMWWSCPVEHSIGSKWNRHGYNYKRNLLRIKLLDMKVGNRVKETRKIWEIKVQLSNGWSFGLQPNQFPSASQRRKWKQIYDQRFTHCILYFTLCSKRSSAPTPISEHQQN